MDRTLSSEEQTMYEFLGRAMEEFGWNGQAPRLIRHLASRRPNLFFVSAVRLLRDAPAGPGRKHLAAILLNDPDLFARVTDPRNFTRMETAVLFQRLMTADPLIDVRLARELPDRYGHARSLNLKASAQVLDVLDQISPGRRLIHMIGYLSEHSDQDIAAKATLLVARRIQSSDWIKRHIALSDPRIRANVVEGLWGSNQPYAVTAYRECVHDENNRVVGNALFGLHLVGEDQIKPRIVDMATDGRPPFRWTAAWVMGQAGDPEYAESLHRLVRDDMPGVRRAALRSLITIRRLTHPRLEASTEEKAPSEEAAGVVAAASEASSAATMESPGWHCPGLRLDGRSFRSREAEAAK